MSGWDNTPVQANGWGNNDHDSNKANQWETNGHTNDKWASHNATNVDRADEPQEDWGLEEKTETKFSSFSSETKINTTFLIDESNISKHAANGDYEAPKDNSCRNCGGDSHFARECTKPKRNTGECYNCGQTGHNKAECPEPKKNTGQCFNCGEIGHNKSDCTNPTIERPFTGECRICQKEGHRAFQCPNRPPIECKNCLKEGHVASECTENRVLDKSDVPDFDGDTAWDMLKTASSEYDMDDFKSAVAIYTKTKKELTYLDLEKAFRKANLNFYLIAQKKAVPNTMTIVDLQGRSECKYVVGYFRSPNARTPKHSHMFPSSAEENLERLQDAGDIMDGVIPVCHNCKERGHMSKACPHEKAESTVPEKYNRCSNCLVTGHILRDCPEERVDRSLKCRNCEKPGHKAMDCPEPRSAAGVECNRCKEIGHYARDCPGSTEGGGSSRACRNCGEGHFARDCEKPKNPANLQCHNCDQMGHFSRDCPKPKDWSRVKCSYCEQMGHTVKRCPIIDAPANSADGFNNISEFSDANGHDSGFSNPSLGLQKDTNSFGFFTHESYDPDMGAHSRWTTSSMNNASNEQTLITFDDKVANSLSASMTKTKLGDLGSNGTFGQHSMGSKNSGENIPDLKVGNVVDAATNGVPDEKW